MRGSCSQPQPSTTQSRLAGPPSSSVGRRCGQDPANDARFFDIGFTEFQVDPINEIRRLYGWLGDELT